MCAAVYEGVLFSIIRDNKKFNNLIEDAIELGVLDKRESAVIDEARDIRNLVHANRYKTPYVSRMQAMDMRALMDKIIKRDWSSYKAVKDQAL